MSTKGVFSALLWEKEADEVLSMIVRERILSVADADDFAILVKGKV